MGSAARRRPVSEGSLARRALAAALGLLVVMAAAPAAADIPERPDGETVRVVVRGVPGAFAAVREEVLAAGGTVSFDLPIVDGVAASVPAAAVAGLSAAPSVAAVSPDEAVVLNGRPDRTSRLVPLAELTTDVLDVDRLWKRGITGDGVGVALIDSGVSPVSGTGSVFHGPDLSFDSPSDDLRNLDGFGHGTHLAGIIAGADPGLADRPRGADARHSFAGVAPGAHIVSVKVADAAGAVDVSQVIYAIQWVVEHKDGEVPIDVLALAFGTDGTQDPAADPLAAAVEEAWHAGLVVVVAAGNDGNARPLRNPATDPFVIAVGAVDPRGTPGSGDDRLLQFSNCGTRSRSVDVLAPGRSVASLRVPGSQIDHEFPEARVGDRYFRGTGTSQSAAVVAGIAALVLDARPDLTPDQVKALLRSTADPVPRARGCRAAGTVDANGAVRSRVPRDADQRWVRSDGNGSLEAARGSRHVALDGVPLEGEVDVAGNAWSGGTWSGGTWSGGTWSGGTWSGGTWSGGTWSGGTWSGGTWSGGTWSAGTWSGGTWSGGTWSGGTWSGGTWSVAAWQ